MTCINRVRVRKGARPAGSRLEIDCAAVAHDLRLCDGCELVDFSSFVCFVLLLFYQGSLSRPNFKEERAGLGFFSFLIMENSGNRVSNCVTFGVASGAVE